MAIGRRFRGKASGHAGPRLSRVVSSCAMCRVPLECVDPTIRRETRNDVPPPATCESINALATGNRLVCAFCGETEIEGNYHISHNFNKKAGRFQHVDVWDYYKTCFLCYKHATRAMSL